MLLISLCKFPLMAHCSLRFVGSKLPTAGIPRALYWFDGVNPWHWFIKNYIFHSKAIYLSFQVKSYDLSHTINFFFQAKELRIPTYFVRPASIRIYNDSQIRYATRVNFDVACKMEFQYYPADVQTCEIKLESFGYTNRQMKFSWMKGTVWIFDNYLCSFLNIWLREKIYNWLIQMQVFKKKSLLITLPI